MKPDQWKSEKARRKVCARVNDWIEAMGVETRRVAAEGAAGARG